MIKPHPFFRRMAVKLSVLAVFAGSLGVLGAESLADASPPEEAQTDADQIYARAQSVLAAEVYPADLDYSVVIQASESGKISANHYDGEVLTETQECRVETFSKEEQAQPFTPRGINVNYAISIFGASGRAPVGHPDPSGASILSGPISRPSPPTDLLGIPELTPTYSFGLRPGLRLATAALKEGPPVIGRVGTRTAFYTITVAGRETIDAGEVIHLRFEPLREPRKYRLRDLWVSAADYWPAQARVFGNFTVEPETSVPWLVRFVRVDGATYIATETAEGRLRRGNRTFDSAVIRFENIRRHHGPRDLRFAVPLEADDPGRLIEPEQLVRSAIQ